MTTSIEEVNKKLSEMILKARHRCGLTVKEAATFLGMSEREILQMERNPVLVPLNKLSKMMALYRAGRSDLVEALPLVERP